MEIGNIVEISDQKLYFGILLFRGGDGLLDPKSRLRTHIRRYWGLEMNFKIIIILKKLKFLSKNIYVPHGHEKTFDDHVAHNYFSIKNSSLKNNIFMKFISRPPNGQIWVMSRNLGSSSLSSLLNSKIPKYNF